MLSFEQKLENYAELAVKVGANVQPGQTLVVNAMIDAAPLVRLIVKKAYEIGAKLVKVNYSDEVVNRIRYDLAPDESFLEPPKYYVEEVTELAEQGAAFLTILSSNPDLLKGVDPERISNYQRTYGAAMSKYRQYQQADKMSWTGLAYASPDWAAKVFPDVPQEQQVDKMWDAIFHAVRADLEDPIQAWEDHIATLQRKSDELNQKKYSKLRFTSPGTDLTIELPEGHIWAQAGSHNEKGERFVANIPTEEVFTAPLKTGVNGTVRSTKPLSYGGNIIDNFSLTFENGRIVNFSAEQGEDTLSRLISMDEGSHYLGEVALVPYRSPISESGILYYNTLFDENASCHLAIGSAYAFNLEGGKTMTPEQLQEHGLNSSITHVDFMMGSKDLQITGITRDGREEPVFINGNWA
ncbi:aminopeptidase [Paenibacillus lactis]|uniref:Peptidase M29 aminopeptidase II n=2 Tax=Paenibacillus lactis TaxID=228574 RepID=G4HGA8_9BACL|nr:aminopeptidase [Paenibacillus lactis]EHB64119.1 peptidase M29 aminopeptidase II [Paenibacillus lactis 154]MBP1895231.1 aminopeptidase [Paenibacillus lactis]MCM3492695.1 aminopeptidase [Paenibacillus lactis]HAF97713.1 aminopeptidase [Paenibacillus lactis]